MYDLKRALPSTKLSVLLRPQQQHICPLQGRWMKDRCQEGIMLAERWQNVGQSCQLAHFLQSVSVSHQNPLDWFVCPSWWQWWLCQIRYPGVCKHRAEESALPMFCAGWTACQKTGECSSLGRCEKKTWQNTNGFGANPWKKKDWMRFKII